MLRHVNEWIKRLSRTVDARVARQIGEALEEPVVTYSLPGAPPTGRHVMTTEGWIFVRITPPPTDDGYFAQWGAWARVDFPDASLTHWYEVLCHGPLVLLPLNDQERADAILYGPPGARWGTPPVLGKPETWCPFVDRLTRSSCYLGALHAGPHRDSDGDALGLTFRTEGDQITASVTREDYETFCTCGRPSQHLAYCRRYGRMTGTESDENGI